MRKMKYLPKTAQLVNDKGRTPVPKLIILQYAGNLTDLPEVSTEGYRQKLTEKRQEYSVDEEISFRREKNSDIVKLPRTEL